MMEIHTDLLLMQRKILEERERSWEMMIYYGFEQDVLSEKVHKLVVIKELVSTTVHAF